jgi:hypothetical protein
MFDHQATMTGAINRGADFTQEGLNIMPIKIGRQWMREKRMKKFTMAMIHVGSLRF